MKKITLDTDVNLTEELHTAYMVNDVFTTIWIVVGFLTFGVWMIRPSLVNSPLLYVPWGVALALNTYAKGRQDALSSLQAKIFRRASSASQEDR